MRFASIVPLLKQRVKVPLTLYIAER